MRLKAPVLVPFGSTTLRIEPGAVVEDGQGNRLVIKRFDSPSTVVVRNLSTGLDEIAPLSGFSASDPESSLKQPFREVEESVWQEVIDRFNLILPLLEHRTTEMVHEAARAASVAPATIYRWIQAFQEKGVVTSLLRKKRKDAGKEKLGDEVEKLISKVINEHYLTKQKRKKRKAYRELERLCRHQKLVKPSFTTFCERINRIAPREHAEKRLGKNAGLKHDLNKGTVPNADTPYAVIQIDHTLVDILLVDEEHRIAIGKPWITVAIDVWSRMVAGYYISFDPPGALGTGICIANMILSKEKELARLGLDVAWPCMGIPRIIHVDNAKEFRGTTLKIACNEYVIDLRFRKVKKPNYGGHIESYLGTLMEEIHALPGTTFADKEQRAVYDSEKHAAMTLPEFERWLGNLILGKYHYDKHTGIGMPPIKRYSEGLLGSADQPGLGAITLVRDEERLRINFLPIVHRTIQPYGVELDNIHYFSDVLRRWVGAPDPKNRRAKRKFLFRRDPRDISYLLFYDPDAKQYFRIPYQDTSKPRMSLWELRAVKRWLADQGKKSVDEEQIFKALDTMRTIEEEAKTMTRKVRLARERRKHHEKVKPLLMESAPAPIEPSVDVSQLQPFDEIERI